MAEDHRYSWLDDSAAERLLRGEPVEGRLDAPDGRSDQSRAEAERLAAVLGAAAGTSRLAAGSADGTPPLPGEEAAVAAFRAAREERAAAAPSGPEPAGGRGGQALRALRAGFGARRQLRAGMVAALAGCALSGFAVAAAAGVLPTPFGESGDRPGPMVSMPGVSPSDGPSVHPQISGGGTSPTPGPAGSGDNDASDAASNGGQGPTTPTEHEGDGSRQDKGGEKGTGDKDSAGGPNGSSNDEKWAVNACRRYLASEHDDSVEVSRKTLHQLKQAAGSKAAIHGYCVQLLGDGGTEVPGSGSGDGTDSGSDDGSGGTDGGEEDGGGSGDDGGSDRGGTSDGGEDGGDGGSDGGNVPQPPPPPPTDTPTGTSGDTPTDASADTSGDAPTGGGTPTATGSATG